MVVDQDIEALSDKVTHNEKKAVVNRVIRNIIIADTTDSVRCGRIDLQYIMAIIASPHSEHAGRPCHSPEPSQTVAKGTVANQCLFLDETICR